MILYKEVKHSDYLYEELNTDTGRYEWVQLPDNITITEQIDTRDLIQGIKNTTPVQM